MKYLHYYEHTEDDNENEETNLEISKLKKYIVWSHDNKVFEILENKNIIEKEYNSVRTLNVIHLYDYKNGTLTEKDDLPRTSGLVYDKLIDSIKMYLKYQSDNLEDCIDFLELITYSNKYNL